MRSPILMQHPGGPSGFDPGARITLPTSPISRCSGGPCFARGNNGPERTIECGCPLPHQLRSHTVPCWVISLSFVSSIASYASLAIPCRDAETIRASDGGDPFLSIRCCKIYSLTGRQQIDLSRITILHDPSCCRWRLFRRRVCVGLLRQDSAHRH
jgi:hypothetical protein